MLENYGIKTAADILMSGFRGGKMLDMLSVLSTEHNVTFNANFNAKYPILVAVLLRSELLAFPEVLASLGQIKRAKCVASSALVEQLNLAFNISQLNVSWQLICTAPTTFNHRNLSLICFYLRPKNGF
jgi:hypothetical protein